MLRSCKHPWISWAYVFLDFKKMIRSEINVLTHYNLSLQDSDGEKSDDNLVVDVSNEVYTMLFFCMLQWGGWGYLFCGFCAYLVYE